MMKNFNRMARLCLLTLSLVASLLAFGAPPAGAADGANEFVAFTNSATGLQLAGEDLGKKNLEVRAEDLPIGEWELVPAADGRVALRNNLTQTFVSHDGKKKVVLISIDQDPLPEEALWTIIETSSSKQRIVSSHGRFLAAKSDKVGKKGGAELVTTPSAAADWTTVTIDPSSYRTVRISTQSANRALGIVSAKLGSNVSTTEATNALTLWQELAVDDRKFLLRNLATGEYLHPSDKKSAYNVNTIAVPDDTDRWEYETLETGSGALLKSKFGFLTEEADDAFNVVVEKKDQDASSWSVEIAETDGLCASSDSELTVLNYVDGDTVDLGEGGTGTGSVQLSGSAAAGTTSVSVSIDDETASIPLESNNCNEAWSLELTPPEGGSLEVAIVATDATGDTQTTTLTLNIIEADEDDVLTTPEFDESLDLETSVVGYTPESGELVLAADARSLVEVGSVLAAPAETEGASEGFFVVVESVTVDANGLVVLTTREASLVEAIRQIDIDQESLIAGTPESAAPGQGNLLRNSAVPDFVRPETLALKYKEGDEASAVSISFDGTATFTTTFSFRLKIAWSVTGALSTLVGNPDLPEVLDLFAQATVDYGVSGDFKMKGQKTVEDTLDTLFSLPTPLVIPLAGPLQINFRLEAIPFIKIAAAGSVNVAFDLNGGREAIGFDLNRTNDQFFRDSTTPTMSSNPEFLDLSGSVSLSAAAGVSVQLTGKLTGGVKIVNIGVKVGPKLSFEIQVGSANSFARVDVKLSLEVTPFATLKLEYWDYELFSVTLTLQGVSIPLGVDEEIDLSDLLARIQTSNSDIPTLYLGELMEYVYLRSAGKPTIIWDDLEIPAGLYLSSLGQLSGTPTQLGRQRLEVTATSFVLSTDTKVLFVDVVERPPAGNAQVAWNGTTLEVSTINGENVEGGILRISAPVLFASPISPSPCVTDGLANGYICTLPTITPGAPVQIPFDIQPATDVYSITAALDELPEDPDPSNNSTTRSVAAIPKPDPTVSFVGNDVYLATANGGAFDEGVLTISWTGGDNLVSVSGTPNGLSCSSGSRQITCQVTKRIAQSDPARATLAFVGGQAFSYEVTATVSGVSNAVGNAPNSDTKTISQDLFPDRVVSFGCGINCFKVEEVNGFGISGATATVEWTGSPTSVQLDAEVFSSNCSGQDNPQLISGTNRWRISCAGLDIPFSRVYAWTIASSASQVTYAISADPGERNTQNNSLVRPDF